MIAFLQPLALLGLAAAAIPTVLHLLTRRVPPTVTFPAVRYLKETEREQSRRIKLRHLLLLLLRTGLIASVVLAAARPVATVAVGGAHAPTALAVVIDNSLSSGAVVEGRRVVELLAARARAVVSRVDEGDRLWLTTVDGVPRPITKGEALAALDSIESSPRRLDLGAAARAAAGVVSTSALAEREVVLLSDLQRSALSGGDPVRVRLLAWTPGLALENRSIDSARAEPTVWSPGGRLVAAVGAARVPGSDRPAGPVAVRLVVGGQEVARAVGAPGDRVVLSGRGARRGWVAARVSLDPDELPADDEWYVAIHVAEPAPAAVEPGGGRYAAEALAVLQEGGRAGRGNTVVLSDRLAGLRSIVVPPEDPARLGVLNRALAARGVVWHFGDLVQGEWPVHGDVGGAEGATVRRRHRLLGSGVVVARAGDDPWVVRDQNVVLVGSRLEESWTELPVAAAFVPFVDLLVNRVAAGESRSISAYAGDPVQLPPEADAVLTPAGPVPVSGDGRITAPRAPGVYFLRAASGDTVGALEVNHDPRESQLDEADQPLLRATLGPGVQLLDARGLHRELFGGARRGDLTGPFLLVALLAACAEFFVSSVGARAGRGRS